MKCLRQKGKFRYYESGYPFEYYMVRFLYHMSGEFLLLKWLRPTRKIKRFGMTTNHRLRLDRHGLVLLCARQFFKTIERRGKGEYRIDRQLSISSYRGV